MMEAATKQIEERKKQLSFASSVPSAPVMIVFYNQNLKAVSVISCIMFSMTLFVSC